MNSDNKFFVIVVVAVVAIAAAVVIFSKGNQPPSQLGDVVEIDYAAGQKMGSDEAKIKIVEFSDFQCPACAASDDPLFEAIADYQSDVQFIYRHFPLTSIHAKAIVAAQASEAAAAQGKFFEMKDLIFSGQGTWSNSNNAEAIFESYAESIGLDLTKYRADFRSSEFKKRINDDKAYGSSLGVNQTPTFFVNGKRYPGGRSAGDWRAIFDEILAQ